MNGGHRQSLAPHWFPKETHGLLTAFLKHQSTHRVLCGLIEGFDVTVLKMDLGVNHYDRLLAMREREAGRWRAGGEAEADAPESLHAGDGAAAGAGAV